jgi:uncharacterized protein YjbI with pentapeptide repeats
MKQEELDKILEQHRLWLDTDKEQGKRADLRYADLRRTNLSNANLSEVNLSGADLSGANLSDADLSCANLSGAKLRCANLDEANLRYANLHLANLRYANLYGANLIHTDLSGADLRSADLDYSAWPLWCGSAHSNIKVDKLIAAQLLYHACIIAQQHVDVPEEITKFISENFHRYNEVEKLKGDNQ